MDTTDPVAPVPDRSGTLQGLRARAEAVPNWLRALSVLAAWLSAVLARSQFGEPVTGPLTAALFVALFGFALFAHWPVFTFDGPLPFSDAGLHASGGRVIAWERVLAVEPLGDKDLEAVLDDGQRVKVRVRGNRTRAELRTALAHRKPEAVRF
jgi:hypothetical protein